MKTTYEERLQRIRYRVFRRRQALSVIRAMPVQCDNKTEKQVFLETLEKSITGKLIKEYQLDNVLSR